jgi:hypothetical protein
MLDAHRPSSRLLDRFIERDGLDRLVAGVLAGQSPVVVLRGEAGVGKTALLRHLSAAAEGCRIARAAGVESEMELAGQGRATMTAGDTASSVLATITAYTEAQWGDGVFSPPRSPAASLHRQQFSNLLGAVVPCRGRFRGQARNLAARR